MSAFSLATFRELVIRDAGVNIYLSERYFINTFPRKSIWSCDTFWYFWYHPWFGPMVSHHSFHLLRIFFLNFKPNKHEIGVLHILNQHQEGGRGSKIPQEVQTLYNKNATKMYWCNMCGTSNNDLIIIGLFWCNFNVIMMKFKLMNWFMEIYLNFMESYLLDSKMKNNI